MVPVAATLVTVVGSTAFLNVAPARLGLTIV
jgi:hypothetical protein